MIDPHAARKLARARELAAATGLKLIQRGLLKPCAICRYSANAVFFQFYFCGPCLKKMERTA